MTKLFAPLMMACTFFVLANATAQDSPSCCSVKPAESASCCTAKSGDAHADHGAVEAQPAPHASQGEGPESTTNPHADHAAGAETAHAMPACCAKGGGKEMHQGNKAMGGMHGGQGRGAVMPDAMGLLHNHAALERTVEEIPNGVKTVTTTSDPELLAVLRRHPREMYAFYEAGGSVRPHDPMFAELARVADKVHMEFRDIENGVETIATSDDPEVVKLIRAHAAKVTEFVKRGHSALQEGAPLPEDYKPAR
jgi:hypothetical protein